MSVDHQIHIANNSSEDIYVLPVPNTDWVWADIGFDIGTIVLVSIATFGTGTAAAAGNAVRSLNTLQKVIKFVKWIAFITEDVRAMATYYNLAKNTVKVSKEQFIKAALDDLQKAKDFLEHNAIKISQNDYKQVFKEGVWIPTRYLSPSGIASAFDASDMTLFIITESLSRMVTFNTNGDYSWIVNNNEVVRAEHGRIWQESRKDGFYRFAVSNMLYAPQSLSPGQCLSSTNGNYDFVYQQDGNAVIYERDKPEGERPIWASNTKGETPSRAVIQDDGNFVIYNLENKAVWAANTNGGSPDYQGAKLCMEDDGKLVLYKADNEIIWAVSEGYYQYSVTRTISG